MVSTTNVQQRIKPSTQPSDEEHHFSRSCPDAPRPALNHQPIWRTLRVQTGIPTRSVGTRNLLLVPTLRVGMQARTLRVLH
jgi:hypothetical protein